MPVLNRIAEFHADMTAWRQDLHRHPELAFKEHRTSAEIQARLHEFGVDEVHVMAGTGVVGVIHGAQPGEAIGLRGGYRRAADPGGDRRPVCEHA